MNWFNKHGLLGLNPGEITKENAGLRTSQYYLFAYIAGKEPYEVCRRETIRIMLNLCDNPKKEIRSWPRTANRAISHDDITGLACAVYYFGLWDRFKDKFPIIHWRRWHPRDIAFYFSLHYPKLYWIGLWFTSGAMIVSCMQTYKIRNGEKQYRLSGKILALMRCCAFDMQRTERVCSWAIAKNKHFRKWSKIFIRYYKNPEHPTRKVMIDWRNV